MGLILTSPKILADATASGFRYLEDGDFKTSKIYLEYVMNEVGLKKIDQFILYALAIDYYNLGHYDKSGEIITTIRELEDVNQQVLETIDQLENELKKIKQEESVSILNDEFEEPQELERFREIIYFLENREDILNEIEKSFLRTKDPFYLYILDPRFNEEKRKIFMREAKNYLPALDAVEELQEWSISDEQDVKELYEIYHKSALSAGHSIFFVIGLATGEIQNILLNKSVSMAFKQELLFDINYFTNHKYLNKRTLTYTDENNKKIKINIKDMPVVDKYLEKMYIEVKKESKDILKTPIYKLILDLMLKYTKLHYFEIETIKFKELYIRVLNFIYNSDIVLSKQVIKFLESKNLNKEKTKDKEMYEILLFIENR